MDVDFSKVRLADFAQARLREEPFQAQESKVHAGLQLKAPAPPQPAGREAGTGTILAHAPQYTATLTALSSEAAKRADEIQGISFDSKTGYALAVLHEGVLAWRAGSDNTLLFPMPLGDSEEPVAAAPETPTISAIFVPPPPDAGSSRVPGLVAVNCATGALRYWDSVTRALIASSTSADADSDAVDAEIKLSHGDRITHLADVAPAGLVASTARGHFYLVNLRDDLGRRNFSVSTLRTNSSFLGRLRMLGAWARDVVAVRAGRALAGSARELYIINKYGDVALWHVWLNGGAELKAEHRVGTLLHMHMNMLYPNSGLSLVVHDIVTEPDLTHVLASFAPRADSAKRYFIVASLTQDFEIVSVQRVQAYESESGIIDRETTLLAQDGVLVMAFGDAVAMLDSPSRSQGSRRWEEAVALKPSAKLLGSGASGSATNNQVNGVMVATSQGIVTFAFSAERNSESTTKARLEQAVFDSQEENPLDLTKWPAFSYDPDASAASQLAVEIAVPTSRFLPAKLAQLGDHLDLRAHYLKLLYAQAPEREVGEVSQTVIAAAALWRRYETGEGQSVLNSYAKSLGTTVKDLLQQDVLASTPKLLSRVASSVATGVGATSASTSASKEAIVASKLLVSTLEAVDSDGIGMPSWAGDGQIRLAIELLTAKAAGAEDGDALSVALELLCAINDSNVAKKPEGAESLELKSEPALILELASIGYPDRAADIARKFMIFTALAPLEVGSWLNGDSSISVINDNIRRFGDSYATAVFDSCIKLGHARELVTGLAPEYSGRIKTYLESNHRYDIAWTLHPGSAESTQYLEDAMAASTTLDARRVSASLYKLASITSQSGNPADADRTLTLVNAQNSLLLQKSSFEGAAPTLESHGLTELRSGRLLNRNDAVDLLALAPPQLRAETNDNFVEGFSLLSPDDSVRRSLLVQRLVRNSNWERLLDAKNSEQKLRRARQTLFWHTWSEVSADVKSLLHDFRLYLQAPSPDDVRRTYPWDLSGSVLRELARVSEEAMSIADKYLVDEWVKLLEDNERDEKPVEGSEENMDVD